MSAAGFRRLAWVVGPVVAVGFVVVLSALVGAGPYVAVGNADPGAVVRFGTPLLRLVNDVAAALCTGGLAFGAFFTRPQGGSLSPHGYAAVRLSGLWGVVWAATAAVMVFFETANSSGLPLSSVASPDAFAGLVSALEGPKGWLLEAVVALVVAIGSRVALTWRPVVGLFALAVFALLPPLATGHAASDTGHDVATAALMLHVVAAALWVGVVVALIAHVRRGGQLSAPVARRYERLATSCWFVLAATGVATSWELVDGEELLTTPYGLVLLVSAAVLIVLGALVVVGRRNALRKARSWTALARSAVFEFVALAVGVGVASGLAHLAPPALVDHQVTGQETLLGFDLPGAPTVANLALAWRIDVFFAPLAVALAAFYLAGVVRLHRRGEQWFRGRAAAWMVGCALLLVATSSGVGRYAPAMFSVHIAHHMVIGMLVPMLLALGGPLGLAARVLPEEGLREWLELIRTSALVRWLTHPAVALVLFVGAPFLVYFTSLFDAAMRFHWAQQALTAVFLVIGCLFAWVVVGVDELPRPLPALARLGMLLAAMPGDAVFAAAVMNTHRVLGNGPASYLMYDALHLPWIGGLLGDQWTGGVLALAIGELSLLVALAAVLARWSDEADDRSGPGGYDALLAQRAQRATR
jgi:putative copper resistance protein D